MTLSDIRVAALRQRSLITVLAIIGGTMACRSPRTVKIGWDPPAEIPDGYRVLIDEEVVLDIPPPPIDPNCHCLKVELQVPRGRHTVSVVAYGHGAASPSASLIVE